MNPALPIAILLLSSIARAQPQTRTPEPIEHLIHEVRALSFPELSTIDIQVCPFTSQSDYFQARFSILRFFFAKRMKYFVRVNSNAAAAGLREEPSRAIVAHELAHISYYASNNRLHLLNLLRLTDHGFRERFEKRADADAIERGYAQGLKQYRIWLYQHVPAKALAEKKRDYYSPQEIEALARESDVSRASQRE